MFLLLILMIRNSKLDKKKLNKRKQFPNYPINEQNRANNNKRAKSRATH